MSFNKFKFFTAAFLFSLFFTLAAAPCFAAHLELRPEQNSYSIGDTAVIDLYLSIDSTEKIWGASAEISFDSAKLQYLADQFVAGTLFSPGGDVAAASSGNLINIGGYFQDDQSAVVASGVVAKLKFKVLSSGTAVFLIACPSDYTGVYQAATSAGAGNPNVLICVGGTNTINLSLTGGGSEPLDLSTPVSQVTSAASFSQALTSLPETGIWEQVAMMLGTGTLLVIFGAGLKYKQRKNI